MTVKTPTHVASGSSSYADTRQLDRDDDPGVVRQIRCGDRAAMKIGDQSDDVQAQTQMRLAVRRCRGC